MSTNPASSSSVPIEVTGLSISSCILAMAEGKVPQHLVVKVIGGTSFEDFDGMWAEYSQKYWAGNMLRARAVFYTLAEQKRIDQPRLRGQEPPDSSAGVWLIGTRQYDTPSLQDLLGASDTLGKMSPTERGELLEAMPADVISVLRNAIGVGALKALIPDFQTATATMTEADITKKIKERLKEFVQALPGCDPKEAYAEVLHLLQAFIRSKGQDKPKAPPKEARPAKYSQYRPAIKLPDSGK
jgi:hypothetical protein